MTALPANLPLMRPEPEAMAPDRIALSISGLTKRFPVRATWKELVLRPFTREQTTVLDDVTLDIRDGEFFGLLGPNGAGKTTLFKILSTLVLPDSGTATVLGHDVQTSGSKVRRLLAPVIADERSLYWRLSARENLRLFAHLQGLRGDEAALRVTELLGTVGLDHTRNQMVGSFSSGMKQRLLIARALLAKPRVLLLDEPTRSLDPVSARTFREFLRDDIVRAHGCTVLLATHNAEEALELCHRVGVLHRGRLLAVGTADALSRELGEERWRLWTSDPMHQAIGSLELSGEARLLGRDADEEPGWTRVDMVLSDGMQSAATILSRLARAGVPVARFERVGLTLADLIERVVARAENSNG